LADICGRRVPLYGTPRHPDVVAADLLKSGYGGRRELRNTCKTQTDDQF
jgi:hypothetical protein